MRRRTRILLIGCGDIAASGHLPAIARSRDTELVGVVDPDGARRDSAATQYGVPGWPTLAEAMATAPDAAIIAVPPQIAPTLTIAAIEAGLDVLCEKPMAVDIAEARRVHEIAEASDRVVQIGFKNRFSPLVRAARRWIEEGLLGEPLVYTLGGYDESYSPSDPLHTSRILHFLDHGPSFVHEGAHFADYLNYLGAGRPLTVQALGVRSREECATENFAAALVRYEQGGVARLEIGWQFPISPKGDFRILGPLGCVILDRLSLTVTLDHLVDGVLHHELITAEHPWNDECFDAQLEHFIDCVTRRATPETSTEAGLHSLALGRAVADAMQSGQTVEL